MREDQQQRLWQLAGADRLYMITRSISQGPFPSVADCKDFRQAGITHLFNVDREYSRRADIDALGFAGIAVYPIEDGRRIPDQQMLDCLAALNAILVQPDTHVYIHCRAGVGRSPTVLWLYLVACGLEPGDAKLFIKSRAPYSSPGESTLCDGDLVQLAVDQRSRYCPPPRAEILQPW